ncbi:epimerase [Pseudokineococcus sp. 1T1Z-3]|uniref:epimerase n=1 Tax=Pseudokineococcus sp. 1T1Z-3 TaxID=3132745 RepID=UPI00309F3750
MKVVVAGGSGSLGRRLCGALDAVGHDVVVLTRSPRGSTGYREVAWDGRTVGGWAAELEGAAVVNLAGELVDRRPTPENVRLLRDSRVEPTRALREAAASLDRPVPVWVQVSTLAIYGDAGDAVLTEDSPLADGPPQMAGVARAWEEAVVGADAERTVVLRTGVVLDRDSPALDRLLFLARAGLGGRIASGQQWVSWIHVADWLAVVARALGDPGMDGVYLATSPGPVRNEELMATVRRTTGNHVALPNPTFVVRLGARLLRTDPALALTGRRAQPARLLEEGFTFRFDELRPAVADLMHTEPGR